jgi:hypothetical protein
MTEWVCVRGAEGVRRTSWVACLFLTHQRSLSDQIVAKWCVDKACSACARAWIPCQGRSQITTLTLPPPPKHTRTRTRQSTGARATRAHAHTDTAATTRNSCCDVRGGPAPASAARHGGVRASLCTQRGLDAPGAALARRAGATQHQGVCVRVACVRLWGRRRGREQLLLQCPRAASECASSTLANAHMPARTQPAWCVCCDQWWRRSAACSVPPNNSTATRPRSTPLRLHLCTSVRLWCLLPPSRAGSSRCTFACACAHAPIHRSRWSSLRAAPSTLSCVRTTWWRWRREWQRGRASSNRWARRHQQIRNRPRQQPPRRSSRSSSSSAGQRAAPLAQHHRAPLAQHHQQHLRRRQTQIQEPQRRSSCPAQPPAAQGSSRRQNSRRPLAPPPPLRARATPRRAQRQQQARLQQQVVATRTLHHPATRHEPRSWYAAATVSCALLSSMEKRTSAVCVLLCPRVAPTPTALAASAAAAAAAGAAGCVARCAPPTLPPRHQVRHLSSPACPDSYQIKQLLRWFREACRETTEDWPHGDTRYTRAHAHACGRTHTHRQGLRCLLCVCSSPQRAALDTHTHTHTHTHTRARTRHAHTWPRTHRAVLSLPASLTKVQRAAWHAEADRLGLNSTSTVRQRMCAACCVALRCAALRCAALRCAALQAEWAFCWCCAWCVVSLTSCVG